MKRTAAALCAALLPALSGAGGALELKRPALLGDVDASPAVPLPGLLREIAPPAGVVHIDLSGQFPDSASRNQGNIGDCHAFASVGVLEAAWFRRSLEHRRFSEADLFLNRSVLTGEVYKPFIEEFSAEIREGFHVDLDLQYALAHGVSSSDQYAKVEERYVKLREYQKRKMSALQEYGMELPISELAKAPKQWTEFIQSQAVRNYVARAGELNSYKTVAQREEAKKGFQGLKLGSRPYPYLGQDVLAMSAGACALKGEAQRRHLLAELRAGRPVAVSMTLAGLPEWRQTGARHAEHAFVIVGARGSESTLTFQTRNSWGGLNPPVRADQLCRVHAIASILIPGERTGQSPSR